MKNEISKRVVYDRDTKKNYIVKQETEEIPQNAEVVSKIRAHLRAASKLIPRLEGSKPIGFIASFCYERSSSDKFDYQSASIVDLKEVNVKASDLMLKDLVTKIERAYGREPAAVRQDAPAINE